MSCLTESITRQRVRAAPLQQSFIPAEYTASRRRHDTLSGSEGAGLRAASFPTDRPVDQLSDGWCSPNARRKTRPGCDPTAEEFTTVGWSLKDGLPYQPWAADLVKTRRAELRLHDPLSHCLPT